MAAEVVKTLLARSKWRCKTERVAQRAASRQATKRSESADLASSLY